MSQAECLSARRKDREQGNGHCDGRGTATELGEKVRSDVWRMRNAECTRARWRSNRGISHVGARNVQRTEGLGSGIVGYYNPTSQSKYEVLVESDRTSTWSRAQCSVPGPASRL